MAIKEEPSPAQWALDLLEPTPFDQSNHFSKYFMVPLVAFLSVKAVHIRNVFYKMPKNANVPVIVGAGAMGGFLGYLFHVINNIGHARYDAVLRDYIRLHPERFPEPENRKYADIFRPWNPVR